MDCHKNLTRKVRRLFVQSRDRANFLANSRNPRYYKRKLDIFDHMRN